MARYCFTDIHGNKYLWDEIKYWCGADDEIYFLGDACDRGPAGLHIIKDLLTDPRVIYIKGNHEDILINILKDLLENGEISVQNYCLSMSNGGEKTLADVLVLTKQERLNLYNRLNSLPEKVTIRNSFNDIIYLSHAGHSFHNPTDLLWNRTHFLTKDNDHTCKEYIIHGHTPTISMAKKINYRAEITNQPDNFIHHSDSCFICKYNDGYKINLDIATAFNRRIALFNLDTLEVEKYFMEPGE